jgi:hypothetical protein
MRWVRAKRKYGGGLALFALALQFMLSFAHIHREDIFGPGVASFTLSAAEGSRPLSTDPHPGHNDDYCAICATMYLLGSSPIPEAPPLLPLSFVWQRVDRFEHPVAAFVALGRRPFQSRAPPSACTHDRCSFLGMARRLAAPMV